LYPVRFVTFAGQLSTLSRR